MNPYGTLERIPYSPNPLLSRMAAASSTCRPEELIVALENKETHS